MIIHLRRGEAGGETSLITYDLSVAAPDGTPAPDWDGASVSTALRFIQRHVDPSLAYLLSCRRGLCNVCALKIDGTVKAACITALSDGMVIEAARDSLLLRDTIAELSLVRKARVLSPSITK